MPRGRLLAASLPTYTPTIWSTFGYLAMFRLAYGRIRRHTSASLGPSGWSLNFILLRMLHTSHCLRTKHGPQPETRDNDA
jgi:hypothetical protein